MWKGNAYDNLNNFPNKEKKKKRSCDFYRFEQEQTYYV